jgi:LysM repeat protein
MRTRSIPKIAGLILAVSALGGSPALADILPRSETPRAHAMGGAFTAISNDVGALFSNPAGLGDVRRIEFIGVMDRVITEGVFPQTGLTAAGTIPLSDYRRQWDFGTVGTAFHRTGRSDDSSITDFGFSWGADPAPILSPLINRPIPEGIRTGSTLHFRNRSPSGFGVGLDLGWLYHFPEGVSPLRRGWSAGLAIKEMNTANISGPVEYRLGTAWENAQSVLSLDWSVSDGVSRFFPGIEVDFFKHLIATRLGTGHVPGQSRQLTMGLGLLLSAIQVDISYAFPLGDPFKTNDRILIGVTYRFGAPLLSQIMQDRPGQVGLQEQVLSLQAEKRALQASIKENRSLYDQIQADVNKNKAKSVAAEEELKMLQEKLIERRKDLEKAEKQTVGMERMRNSIEKKIDEEKTEQRRSEIRAPFAGPARKHRVQPGDTLRSISERYYGDPDQWKVIYDANEGKFVRGAPKVSADLVIP